MAARIGVLVVILLVLGAPFAVRPDAAVAPEGAQTLIIISPHREMIRVEFEHAFSEWHNARYGSPVVIDWRIPGGTSDIRRLLMAQYAAAITDGRIGPEGDAEPGVMPYDLLFGGGSYEHDQIKRGVRVSLAGPDGPREVTVAISAPVDFTHEQLDTWFGENAIGAERLYDPDGYYFGLALSSFGIAFNKRALAELGLPEPRTWEHLTDPRYAGWLGLADPRQSGSVATTYDSILNNYGWDDGWRLLRSMAANARYFSSSSAKVVIDVSSGEAAAALAIDFYGRFEAQMTTVPGEPPRVGYVDPAGLVYVDPDPISMLRGAPHPELAKRFIEFALTDAGQALWQLRAVGPDAPPDALGPRENELRRMPVRRAIYENYRDRFTDDIDPFGTASSVPLRGWRSMLGPLFGAFAVDIHDDMTAAWEAMHAARAAGAPREFLEQLDALFFAFPDHTLPDGTTVPLNQANYSAVRNDWRDEQRAAEHRIHYTRFFRDNYRRIVQLVEERI